MRGLVIALVAVVGLAVLLIGGLVAYSNTEFTVCYGIFQSREAAERAAEAGRDAGLGVDVEHRARESAVQFETGETGADAREARDAYREILRRERGTRGHVGSGCLERGPIN